MSAFLLALWAFIEPIKEWVGLGLSGLLLFFGGKSLGKAKEKAKQEKERGDAYEQSLRDIGNASNAGRRNVPDVANDPYNRDNDTRR